jgi:hypothetical protein
MLYSWRVVVACQLLSQLRISDKGISIFFDERIAHTQLNPINKKLLDLFHHLHEQLFGIIGILSQECSQMLQKVNIDADVP